MPLPSSNQKSVGFEPPIRRVLAVDAGSRCIRLLLLEVRFGKLRVLQQDVVDLQEEGLVSAEELKAHLQATLAAWGRPPLVLVLPQQVAISQMVDLPPVPDHEARQLIEAETVKLSGVNESAMIYDFIRIATPTQSRQNFWVTFCQEGEIQSRIAQLGLEDQDFREITTGANALLTAWQAAQPALTNVVLVHAGAQSTTLLVIRQGVGVFASSFPMAGDFFTRAIARLRLGTSEAAEALKRSTNLFHGPQILPGFAEIVDGWAAELKRQLSESRGAAPSVPAGDQAASNFIATGGAFEQPGLLDYLAEHAGLKFQRWPTDLTAEAVVPALGFETALGAGLQAFGHGAQSASLMPANRRAAWKRRLGRQRLEFANAILLGVCLIALALGVWHKLTLIRTKQALLGKVESGLEVVKQTALLTGELVHDYEATRPLFEHQQTTLDTLQSLALLQQARSNRTLWFVLVADQASYFAQPPTLAGTNKPTVPPENEFAVRPREATNASLARPGLIAELCVPEDPDTAPNTLSLVVNHLIANGLKKTPVFARVDLLSEDIRRSLADPKVLLPLSHFALALDFTNTEFQAASAARRSKTPPTGRLSPNALSNP